MTDRVEDSVTYTQTWNFENKLDQVAWNSENVRFVPVKELSYFAVQSLNSHLLKTLHSISE